MAPTVTIGGTSVPIPLFLGQHQWTSVATGSVGSGTAIVDDPDGIYDFAEWSQVVAEESDCSLSRSFTGYAYNIKTSRGPYSHGSGRIHTMTIGDLNALLHMQPLRGGSAKRPRESGDARLAYLMSTPGMDGIVFDNGLITSNTAMFAADDLRDKYHDEVLQSICVAGIGSRIFYLMWDETAALGEEVTLFYSEPDSVLQASTLGISNIAASIDAITTFAPHMDSDLEAQGEEIYCGLSLTYGGSHQRLYTHNATTHAAYFASTEPPGFHRVGVLDLPRVGELDTAQHHSNVWLNVHSGPKKTLSLTLQLPATKVNLINAGMLVDNELSHLMDFETGAVVRVNERTLSLTPDTNGLYDVVLKMSVNGAALVGGGGGDTTPHNPPGHWFSGSFLIQGDGGVFLHNNHSATTADFDASTTYNFEVTLTRNIGPGYTYAEQVWLSDDPDDWFNPTFGEYVLPGDFGDITGSTHTSFISGSFTTPGTPLADVYMVGGAVDDNHAGDSFCQIDFWIDPVGWDTGADDPPTPGQWVYDEPITMTGNAGTTAFPFADGSLSIKVDLIPQPVATYDGATGDFTLFFDPDESRGQQVFATYQGR